MVWVTRKWLVWSHASRLVSAEDPRFAGRVTIDADFRPRDVGNELCLRAPDALWWMGRVVRMCVA